MERLNRLMPGATQEERARFARQFAEALEREGVGPGDPFLLSKLEASIDRAHARRSDPQTSHAAAASVADLRESQQAVLACFALHGPMTDEQLIAAYDAEWKERGWPAQAHSGQRSRRNELVLGGHLRDSGRKAEMSTGRQAVVWEKAEAAPAPAPDEPPQEGLFGVQRQPGHQPRNAIMDDI